MGRNRVEDMDRARRLREVRVALYGEHGGPLLAEALRLPYRIWAGYERGDTIPPSVLQRLVEVGGIDPHWLLTGEGGTQPHREHRRDGPVPSGPRRLPWGCP